MRAEDVEQRRSAAWSGSSSCVTVYGSPCPGPETDQERQRPGCGRQAGRFQVEADQRLVDARRKGQRTQRSSIDRQSHARFERSTTPDERPCRPARAARERRDQAVPCASASARQAEADLSRSRRRPSRFEVGALPIPAQRPRRRCQLACHAAFCLGSAASDPQQRQRASLRSSLATHARPDACRTAVVAGTGPTRSKRSATKLACRSHSRAASPTPPGHRVVQVDDRPFRVRRADLGDHADVVRIGHQQHAGHRLHRPARAGRARRRARHAASESNRRRARPSTTSCAARSPAGGSCPSRGSRASRGAASCTAWRWTRPSPRRAPARRPAQEPPRTSPAA